MFAFGGQVAERETAADSLKILFRLGKSRFEPYFSDNGKNLEEFIANVRDANLRSAIEKIVVTGYASPEGGDAINNRLSRNRGRIVADMIQKQGGVSPELIETFAPGVSWNELRQLVAERNDVPYKDAILNIIDNTPVWIYDSKGRIIGGRRKKLMDLKGGRPYKWMFRNIFPELRSAVGVMLYLKEETVVADTVVEPIDTIFTEKSLIPDSIASEVCESLASYAERSGFIPETKVWYEYEKRQNFALKTNLLYYVALMPNLEVEWRFADRWSALVGGNIAWYANETRRKTYRLAFGTVELRHWLRFRERWSGWYVGPMVGGGLYDLEFRNNRGYRGEGFLAAASGGYMWRIGNNLLIETGVGVGWVYTKFKEYTHADGHNPYLRTKILNYFGPVSLKVSLGWRFDQVVKKTRKESTL